MKTTGETDPVLVTGAGGLIGASACHSLLAMGHPLVPVVRPQGRPAPKPSSRTLTLDLLDSGWTEHVPRVRCVVHAAALLPSGSVSPEQAAEVNRRLDHQVFSFAAARGIRVVYASGTTVYGTARGVAPPSPFSEDSAVAPVGPYAGEKAWAEEEGARRAASAGSTFLALRVCAPYGPGQRSRTVLQHFLDRVMQGQDALYHGSGSREQDFTWHADVGSAFAAAVDVAVEGAVNVASGRPISMRALATLVAQVANPGGAGASASGLADPEEGVWARFDTSRAEHSLRWRATTALRDGLRHLAAARSEAFA